MMGKILKLMILVLVIFCVGLSVTYRVSRNNLLKRLEAASHIAQTEAGPIQYALIGDRGPVILHVHGVPGGFNLTPFFTTDGLEEYRLLTPSRPGYMATPLAVGKTPEEQARAYAALLDELQIDEVIVLPVSGGGPSAITFAAMYPDRTRAFVGLEIASQSFLEPLDILWFMKSDFAYWLMAGVVSNLFDSLVSGEFAERINNSSDGKERFREFLWSTWPLTPKLAGWQNDSEQFLNLSLTPERIKAPTLLLHGTEDNQASYESAEWLVSQIPNARLYRVEGASHTMLLSHKDELSQVINSFLHEVLAKETVID